jgi:hypothetical protein
MAGSSAIRQSKTILARNAQRPLDAMKGCKAWAKRAHAVYEKQTNPS